MHAFNPNQLTKTISSQIASNFDVMEVFQKVEKNVRLKNGFCGLLETASISNKEHTKTLLAISAALQIRCINETVQIIALNSNGRAMLTLIEKAIKAQLNNILVQQREETSLTMSVNLDARTRLVNEFEKLLTVSVFDVIRVVKKLIKTNSSDDETTLFMGTFSFDCVDLFENLPVLEQTKKFPDYEFFLVDQLVVIDHETRSARLFCKAFPSYLQIEIENDFQVVINEFKQLVLAASNNPSFSSLDTAYSNRFNSFPHSSEFADLVRAAKIHLNNGDVFQLVLSRKFYLNCNNPTEAYRLLKINNPSPYMFYLSTNDYVLFGASPESAVKYQAKSRRLSIYPIAGTRPRGINSKTKTADLDLDAKIELELKCDQKEQSEHIMLVDLARNDIARVCEPASRKIDRLMEIDRYSHVMHLVSKVSGTLKQQLDAFHAYQACMNMGTLTGAPKIKASQLIRKYEKSYRGPYGGAVGFINACGDMDTAIVIRSALVADGKALVQAGAGIVLDSDPNSEVKETENKAAAVLQAIALSEKTSSSLIKEVVNG